ncbi:phosphate ABC transporter permease PstA [uncultured Robinsoniella sp.]|uniref:phosphate ABC transporter permease PstA n=1 Tax=uncultured Robinsoniella sp. TaxID=904190 RepID=UPI00374FAC36
MSRKTKDSIVKGLIYGSAGFTVFILVVIIGFIVVKGLPGINLNFLTRNYEDKTTYVTSQVAADMPDNGQEGYIPSLGITLNINEDKKVYISEMDKTSPLKDALNPKKVAYPIEKKDILSKIGSISVDSLVKETDPKNPESVKKAVTDLKNQIAGLKDTNLKIKVVRPGGGIRPMLVTTLYMIGLSLLIAAPIGILSAVYLIEYAKPGKLMRTIHFAIENLAGIPSIIYGLFGSLFFVKICGLQYSLLAGALTLSIILLPTIITTTEEALKAIPRTYRESSLGLGATRLQTVSKVVLPNALPGILVAVLLSIGRIVGESAALLLTAGTVAQIPGALFGNSASGATLTIKMYTLMKEENDLTTACAIGIVLLVIIIVLNFASKMVTKKLLSKKGE